MTLAPPDTIYGDGDPEGLGGQELWARLQRSRENIELSFLLLLAKAANEAIPCADVNEYERLRLNQLELERQALAELQRYSIKVGITEPSSLPSMDKCGPKEQSIWLAPEYARRTLSGASHRFWAIREQQRQAIHRYLPPDDGLNSAPLSIVVVAGVVLVSWAAEQVIQHVSVQPGRSSVEAHESATAAYLTARKSGLSHSQAVDVLRAATASGVISRGIPWRWIAVAFGAGIALTVGTWLFATRSGKGTLSGHNRSCPRRQRRALVMS